MIHAFLIVASIFVLALPATAGPVRTVGDLSKFSQEDISDPHGDIIEARPVVEIDPQRSSPSRIVRAGRGIDTDGPLYRVLLRLWSVGLFR